MKLELRHISKTFGLVRANQDINLTIPSGTIQGVLGENGAGKSTLMKILSGFIKADTGEIFLDGRPIAIQSPAAAIQHGVGMLHQDPLDFPPMRIIDNFLLGYPGGLFPNREQALKEFNTLVGQFGFALSPDSYVDSLTVGERQQLEIIRLLWMGVSVLILDEPTTGISTAQKIKLFDTLRKLAADGKTIIFVSHKLEDVEVLCHCVVVLRQGKVTGTMFSPFDTQNLVELMFGKVITFGNREALETGDPILRLHDVCVEDYRLRTGPTSLTVKAGEVIGLAGMEGSGQGTFLQACAGLVRPVSGKVVVKGQNLTAKAYHSFKRLGVAYLPAARLEQGLVPGLTLTEHFVLAEEMKGVFINRDNAVRLAQDRIKAFNIKGTPTSPVEALSGGNQQRALLALLRSPLSLVLMEHPCRGLDIESTIYIWAKLKERCKQGAAILFISSDLDEILQYSDQVLVFYAGHVSKPLDANVTSVDQLGQLIGGKSWEKVQG